MVTPIDEILGSSFNSYTNAHEVTNYYPFLEVSKLKLGALTCSRSQLVGGRLGLERRSVGFRSTLFTTHYIALVHEGKGGAVSLLRFSSIKNIRVSRQLWPCPSPTENSSLVHHHPWIKPKLLIQSLP